jgi:methylenetetrahydrofolate dehydrogenase (NADP+) / methenyltetrahydrofolate cyclohydrolase
MTAQIIDGAAIATDVYAALAGRVAALRARGVQPGLAAIIVGDNAASRVYVRNKAAACEGAGLHSELHQLREDCSEAEVREVVQRLNKDSRVHGILLQLPLPAHLNSEKLLQSIAPEKDVDGFHWLNLGALVAGRAVLAPCTPLGIMTMLERSQIAVEGRHAVVIGRSTIVGKPLALMLIARGATVTVCNSKTPDLGGHTRRADLLAVAVGKAGVIDGSMIKPGAVVIDVGINRLPTGKLAGDVDFASAAAVASHITPVPGGVGRMTVAMLIANTVAAAEQAASPTA